MPDSERVVLAEILRPRGIRGEMLAVSQTDVPGRLQRLSAVHVRLADGADVALELEQAWPHGELWVLKFAGVDSIDAAERFRDGDVWVPRAERAALPEGEHFRSDLLGCELRDWESGALLGMVENFEQYGGPLLLQVGVQVGGKGRDVLIPFVPEICREVDLEGRIIRVQLPDGLLEL